MRGGGNNVEAVIKGVLGHASHDQTGNVGHVGHQQAAFDLQADLGKLGIVQFTGVGAEAGQDDLRLMLLGQGAQLVVINLARRHIFHLVTDEVVQLGAARHWRAVS